MFLKEHDSKLPARRGVLKTPRATEAF